VAHPAADPIRGLQNQEIIDAMHRQCGSGRDS
jgi:hypothetical protein